MIAKSWKFNCSTSKWEWSTEREKLLLSSFRTDFEVERRSWMKFLRLHSDRQARERFCCVNRGRGIWIIKMNFIFDISTLIAWGSRGVWNGEESYSRLRIPLLILGIFWRESKSFLLPINSPDSFIIQATFILNC